MISEPQGDTLPVRPPALFATTHWSVVLLAGRDQNEPAQAALVTLCETYRPPILSFARSLGFPHADAEDRTQGFFLHFLKNNLAGKIERRTSVKFRTFLLRCFKNFLADEHARRAAKKRGGDQPMFSLDEPAGEGQVQWEPADEMSAEKIYERDWATKVAPPPGHSDVVLDVAFTPDGKTLLTCSADDSIKFWDTTTWREIPPSLRQKEYVSALALSPDGTRLATACSDGTMKLWNVATRREVASLKLGLDPFYIAFSPDGQTLAAQDGGDLLRLWRAPVPDKKLYRPRDD